MPTTLAGLVSKAFSLAEKELGVLSELHGDVQSALARMKEADPGLGHALKRAYAYAVFPSVGSAAAVIGGAFGKGEVFRGGKLVGYAAVARLTIGVQVGGQTFRQLLLFENKQTFDRFKAGRTAFAAVASAVLLKAGATASARYEDGVAVYVHSDGGMLIEAAMGGQRLFFRPAVLGRGKPALPNRRSKTAPKRASASSNTPGKNGRSPSSRRHASVGATRSRTGRRSKTTKH